MQTIPIIAVPAQSFSVVLAGQACQISLYSLQTPGDILSTLQTVPGGFQAGAFQTDFQSVSVAQQLLTSELQGYPALYADVSLGTTPIISCRIVRNLIPWLLDAKYYGFAGDFVMVDTLSDTDPVYTGLGSQYQLVYLSAADIAAQAAA